MQLCTPHCRSTFDKAEQTKTGECLPQLGSFLNHSCYPTAVAYHDADDGGR
jgi:hypothetical protein